MAGGGSKKTDCYAEFDGITAKRGTRIECTDGEPTCDMDGQCQGTCTFRIRVCAKQSSARCQSPTVTRFKKNTLKLSIPTPPVTSPTCGDETPVAVPLGNKRTKSKTGRLVTEVDGRPKSDPDSVTLVCRKRTTGTCPTTTTTTIPTCPPASPCGAERITLSSGPGTLTVDSLPPFPFPTGVMTQMDVGPDTGGGHHTVAVSMFSVPKFPIPALNYCSQVTTLGCEMSTNGAVGAGDLWDGSASPTASMTNLLTTADTHDGVCDTTNISTSCAGVAGMNSTGDIDVIKTASNTCGARSLIEIPVKSLTWIEAGCISGADPNCVEGGNPSMCCCLTSTFGDEGGDLQITNFNFVLRPSTDVAMAQYADKNMDGCSIDGSGPSGPTTLVGSPPAGPCCVVGQLTTVAAVGVAMSGGAPLFDLAFASSIPNTVSACGAFQAGSCTVSTNPCNF